MLLRKPAGPRLSSQSMATLSVALLLALLSWPLSAEAPRLILQITVDQLRGDLPYRVYDRLEPKGLRYLLERGVVYRDAHHAHANTETIVGHTTLATGAHPAAHGMIGNVWFDRREQRLVYNVEDARYPLLSADAGVSQKTEIDPTQKKARSSGRSPANIRVSTFSDELALHTAGQAKVFAVSVKDRGAISMAGHTGKAFWFSKKSGEFVTSQFYYQQYPQWVLAWNKNKPAQRYAGKSWQLLEDKARYQYGERDAQRWEVNFPGYGNTFPHAYGPGDGKYFHTLLTLSPAGDDLTLDFAKALIDNESLGTDEVTDYLSVSFSSTDYVGHFFGSSSLEMEDNLLRLDRTVAALLSHVEQQIGLKNTLVVLSADHGGAEVVGYMQQQGFDSDYVRPKAWETAPGMAALKARFGVAEELIQEYFHPYVYLDHELIAAKGLDLAEVQTAVATEISKLAGVAVAVTSDAIRRGELPDSNVSRAIVNNHHMKRSGDIFVVFEPHAYINDMDGLTVAAHHGSPWRYDTFVPVIFAGYKLKPRQVYRPVQTVDIAPTLSAVLGAKPPSGAVGHLLYEVLEQFSP